jgi:hypothetical protein
MSNHTTVTARLAAAAATTAAALLLTVAPATAKTAPEPNFAGPGTSFVVSPPQAAPPVESSIDLRQIGAGALAGLAAGAGAVVVGRSARRHRGHATV